MEFYKKSATVKTLLTFGYAKYKIAWCHYSNKSYRPAIENMKETISYAIAQKSSGNSKKNLYLLSYALKDISKFYVHAQSKEEAISYFDTIQSENPDLKQLIDATKKQLTLEESRRK